MHKARLGLLPELGSAVLLLGNLGGSAGGPLTAMKFGALAIIAGLPRAAVCNLTDNYHFGRSLGSQLPKLMALKGACVLR